MERWWEGPDADTRTAAKTAAAERRCWIMAQKALAERWRTPTVVDYDDHAERAAGPDAAA